MSGEIVVGYDGSEHAKAAVDWAAAEAAHRGVRLRVVYVQHPNLLIGPAGAEPWMVEQVQQISEQLTGEGVERARRVEGLDVRGESLTGPPAGGLVDASTSADLLVVGTRGRGELASALLGSVAYSVSAHASCPVVVVCGDGTRRPGGSAPVVVGVDGSPAAEAALRFAADAAAGSDAELVVVSAWQGAFSGAWAGEYWAASSTQALLDVDKAAERETQDIVDAAIEVAVARHPGLSARGSVVDAPAAKVLVDAGEGAGLLVVGARGRGGFTGLLLGSISHAVIHAATGPVAVVRSGVDDPSAGPSGES